MSRTSTHLDTIRCLFGTTPPPCPEYLTRSGFQALRANNGETTDAFRLHTASISDICKDGTVDLAKAIRVTLICALHPNSTLCVSNQIGLLTEQRRDDIDGGWVCLSLETLSSSNLYPPGHATDWQRKS
ncbi:hypothetical protein EDB19DRAFT_1916241 [Suillus lakei]|nr:hypothetical protein EDB19DRAFT_1916241 [Suillus lakei]